MKTCAKPAFQAFHTAALTGFLALAFLTSAMAADFSGSLKGVTITDAKETNTPPVAAFSFNQNGATFSFNASASYDPDGSITKYQWNFGNGGQGEGVTISKEFEPGQYPVTLTVIDNANGIALTQQNIIYSDGLVIEDAEDGTTSRWSIYNNRSGTASISNEFDAARQSRVIVLKGNKLDDGFALAKNDGSNLGITEGFKAKFSMLTTTAFRIYFQVSTSAGTKYLTYSDSQSSPLGTGSYIYYGLGSSSIDGSWHTFERDLQVDLTNAQQGVKLVSVDRILIRGSIKIDDVVLF